MRYATQEAPEEGALCRPRPERRVLQRLRLRRLELEERRRVAVKAAERREDLRGIEAEAERILSPARDLLERLPEAAREVATHQAIPCRRRLSRSCISTATCCPESPPPP